MAPTGVGPGAGVGVGVPGDVEGDVEGEVEGEVGVLGGELCCGVGVGGTGSVAEVVQPDGYCVPVLIPLGPINTG